jgi:hypothetical protein
VGTEIYFPARVCGNVYGFFCHENSYRKPKPDKEPTCNGGRGATDPAATALTVPRLHRTGKSVLCVEKVLLAASSGLFLVCCVALREALFL